MAKLFETNIVPVRTLSEIFGEIQQEGMSVATGNQGQIILSPRIIGGIAEGLEFRSQDSGARIEILPLSDLTIGMRIIDDTDAEVFKTIVSGTDVGDVIMGDYANDKYAMWDKSASSFIIKGVALTDPTITGIGAGSEIAIQGWQQDMAFSSTDYQVVAWASGTITLMDGTTYDITGANTGNMTALTYIYLDIGTSITVLQHTTTPATAVGSGKILIAVAQNNSDTTSKATLQVFGGKGGQMVAIDNLVANSASTNELISNTAQIKDAVITDLKITGTILVGHTQAKCTDANADETSANTAAAITGQGALATENTADFDTKVSGAEKPANNATVGGVFGTNITGGGTGNNQVGNNGYITTITDSVITVTNLAAINADLGTVTAGSIYSGLFSTGTSAGGAQQRIVINTADDTLKYYNASNEELLSIGVAGIYTEYIRRTGTTSVAAYFTDLDSADVNTAELIRAVILGTASTGPVIYTQHNGLGYSAQFAVAANASRTNATVKISASSGQGPHLELTPIANAPQTPSEGDIYTDTDHSIQYHDGTALRPFVLSGNAQTINGVKTFGSFPITPSSAPTTNYQVANKKYVDDNKGMVLPTAGVTSRAMDAVSGSQTIAHGLGTTPQYIRITVYLTYAGTAYNCQSVGSSNGTNHRCIHLYHTAAGSSGGNSSSYIAYIYKDANNGQYATVAVDGTNITLTWTKVSAGVDRTGFILWEAFA